MTGKLRTGTLAVLVAASALLAGCNASNFLFPPWTLHVQGEGGICRQNVQVDVVGVNRSEIEDWERPSMEQYWAKDFQLRKDSIDGGFNCARSFGLSGECELTISEKDDVWKKWKDNGAEYILVMFDTCADERAWRKRLPLPPRCWEGQTKKHTVEVRIRPSQVACVTVPKAECD